MDSAKFRWLLITDLETCDAAAIVYEMTDVELSSTYAGKGSSINEITQVFQKIMENSVQEIRYHFFGNITSQQILAWEVLLSS